MSHTNMYKYARTLWESVDVWVTFIPGQDTCLHLSLNKNLAPHETDVDNLSLAVSYTHTHIYVRGCVRAETARSKQKCKQTALTCQCV